MFRKCFLEQKIKAPHKFSPLTSCPCTSEQTSQSPSLSNSPWSDPEEQTRMVAIETRLKKKLPKRKTEKFGSRQKSYGECFVKLKHVDVAQWQTGPLQNFWRGVGRSVSQTDPYGLHTNKQTVQPWVETVTHSLTPVAADLWGPGRRRRSLWKTQRCESVVLKRSCCSASLRGLGYLR